MVAKHRIVILKNVPQQYMNKELFVSILVSTVLCLPEVQGQSGKLTEDLSTISSILPQDVSADGIWELQFNDEFRGHSVDAKKWDYYGAKEDLPRRDGFWTDKAVHLDTFNHWLTMHTYEEDGKYYDGCIHTSGKFETTYGYFEIRAQLHQQEGHWPAFWLWTGAVDRVGKGGIDGAELDVFEKFKDE